MNDTKHRAIALKICVYYNLDLEVKVSGQSMLNPKAELLLEQIQKHVPENRLDEFYKKVLNNCKFFPSAGELNDILLSLDKVLTPVVNDGGTVRIGHNASMSGVAGQVEMSGMDQFCDTNGVKMESTGNHTVDDVLQDDLSGMSTKEQLKKYGVNLCREAWTLKCNAWSESQWSAWSVKNRTDAGLMHHKTTVDMRDMEYMHD